MHDPVIFTNARILDTVAGEYRSERHVLVRGGLVESLGDAPPEADGARTIDLAGRTLMPGLCDAHVHVTAYTADWVRLRASSPFHVAAHARVILEGMLARGFTTVRDAGGADWGLAKAVDEGLIDGPRLLYCGHALSQTGGHGDVRGAGDEGLHQCFCCAGLGHVCDGTPEVLRAAREEIRRGATQLKIMASGGVSSPTDRISSTQFSEDELAAIVGEADAALIPVMAHAYTARAVNRALRAGVTSIEHGNRIDDESVALLLEKDAWLVPTLVIYRALVEEGVAAGMAQHLVDQTHEVLDAGIVALRLAYEAGVNIAYGTDLLGLMHRRQLEEFRLRSEVVPNVDLVRQATVNAATLFRMADRIGQVAPGFEADLIVVDGDPLEDIGVLCEPETSPKLVMRGGRVMLDNR